MSQLVANLVCDSCTICISGDANVYSFGNSPFGAHGQETRLLVPTVIPTLQNIQSISTGYGHTVCLDYDGNVFTFGNNRWGQLGIGVDKDTLKSTHVPQKVDLPSCIQVSCGYVLYVYLKMVLSIHLVPITMENLE